MIWFFKRHLYTYHEYVYIYILPTINIVCWEYTCVTVCFCVLYWNHQVLVPSSYSFACLLGLGGRYFGTPMYMVPPLWNSKFWIWMFWKPSKIQHPIFIQVQLFECNKGGFNHALHGASFHDVGYPWQRVPFSVPSNPNGSSYEPKISTSLMIFWKICSARILPNNSTRHAWPPQGTCCTEMDLECHMCLGIFFWITGDWNKKTLQAGCSFNPQNKTLKGSQFQGKFASTELSNWIVNANLRRLPRTVIRCSFWQNQNAYFLEAKHPDCPNYCVSIWFLLKPPTNCSCACHYLARKMAIL